MSLPTLQTQADLAVLRESCELEFKLAAGQDGKGELPKEFWKSYCAMANTNGGIILLGVKEKGGHFSFNSIQKPEKVLKQIFDGAGSTRTVSVNLLTNEAVRTLEIEGHTIIIVDVPRATRRQRPVYLHGNPLGGHAYRRLHEGDHHMSDEEVKLMLAEQQHDSLDDELLPRYGLEDLDSGTLRIYRQTHTNLNPGHIWSGYDDKEFLKAVGGWKRNRETSEEGLTKAGLLMFGQYRSIREVFPNFLLDYMERPEAKSDNRWIDRVTFDGTWPGNLYSFFLKVYPKLTVDLKVPFKVVDGLRQNDSPVHVALREALANTLVHADYRDRAKIYVVKRPDMFGFLNPGLMRIPIETAVQGYESDCRNRTLHEMFRYVNIGEQAGTGLQKILTGWATRHWRQPQLREEVEPNNRTILELHMLDLFDPGILDILRLTYKAEFEALDPHQQLALAITLSEGRLTHARLSQLTNAHPADVSKVLRSLVEKGLLSLTGNGRGAVYRFSQIPATSPEDVFGPEGPVTLDASSTILDASSTIIDASSTIIDSQKLLKRDDEGRLVDRKFHLPFVDSIESLTPEFLAQLQEIAALSNLKKKLDRPEVENIILGLCRGHFITIRCLAKLLDRTEKTLRQDYLGKLCNEQRLRRAFPDTPNHERQAYNAA